ncbi:low temperature requirement protein A [Micromonospora sp. URMC 105]|uniref:low temperature requirement protein A n=1 Tax=Micromonospora sp. URMC 105 TaxID=3423413 RepID=UPI003F1D528D
MRFSTRGPTARVAQDHPATTFEIFFDLVFVFALTRIIAFMGQPPTPESMARGLLLLMLLWFSWSSYAWLGNQTPADVGAVRAGVLVAMAALFVAALVMPEAWSSGPGLDAPLLLALAYVLLRVVHLVLYYWSAAATPGLRARIRAFAAASAVGWVPLVLGAVLGGTAQSVLWVLAFAMEVGGQRVAHAFRGGWPLRGPHHFTERHGLVMIIALGESLVAAGVGAGSAVTRPPVLGVALIGLAVAACLWWLYFDHVAPAARRSLDLSTGDRRDRIASDAYSLSHLLLVVGVIYVALGVEEVLTLVAGGHGPAPAGEHGMASAGEHGPAPAHESMSWPGVIALYGGAALFLAGRLLFRWFSVRAPRRTQAALVGLILVLLPVGRALPAAAALGLLAVALLVIAVQERLRRTG